MSATPEQIRAAYREVLGREADAEGLATYASFPRGAVYLALLDSEEFNARPARVRLVAEQRVRRSLHPVETIRWYHSLDLPGGIVTPGTSKREHLEHTAGLVFGHSVAGKSVLDIGAWDGFFSFRAEREGAASVLATDHFCWSGPGWGTKAGFDLAHHLLQSRCQSRDVDVLALDRKQLGTFDVVLFLAVLYHLPDPLLGLRRAAAMSHDCIVLETVTANDDLEKPLLEYAPGFEGDPTNVWIPNIACLAAMLKQLGFARVEIARNLDTPHGNHRHVVHAWRQPSPENKQT